MRSVDILTFEISCALQRGISQTLLKNELEMRGFDNDQILELLSRALVPPTENEDGKTKKKPISKRETT
jgi:hypothetical protein